MGLGERVNIFHLWEGSEFCGHRTNCDMIFFKNDYQNISHSTYSYDSVNLILLQLKSWFCVCLWIRWAVYYGECETFWPLWLGHEMESWFVWVFWDPCYWKATTIPLRKPSSSGRGLCGRELWPLAPSECLLTNSLYSSDTWVSQLVRGSSNPQWSHPNGCCSGAEKSCSAKPA